MTGQGPTSERRRLRRHPHRALPPKGNLAGRVDDRGKVTGLRFGARLHLDYMEKIRELRSKFETAVAEFLGAYDEAKAAGDKPGQPLYRLNEAWWCVLELAGLPRMTVKALRHSWSTHSVGVIAPEHRAQLLGHRGAKMTDTVYLHRHGPDLARAAALVEEHLRGLLGDVPRSAARLLHFAAPSGAWGAS